MVPTGLAEKEGPKPSALRRLEVGEWKDESGNMQTAWMFPALKGIASKQGTGKAEYNKANFCKHAAGGDRGNQLAVKHVTFTPRLRER